MIENVFVDIDQCDQKCFEKETKKFQIWPNIEPSLELVLPWIVFNNENFTNTVSMFAQSLFLDRDKLFFPKWRVWAESGHTDSAFIRLPFKWRNPLCKMFQSKPSFEQGCQMVCFQTKNLNLGKFWRAWEWKILVYFMLIENILRSFGISFGHLAMLW
jgi:hypothetical protein